MPFYQCRVRDINISKIYLLKTMLEQHCHFVNVNCFMWHKTQLSIHVWQTFLNPDALENIIETTVGRYPQMRQTLRAVSRFFKRIVDNVPLPQIYLPELADVADIHQLSIRKIINIKGKNSGAVIALKHIINAKNWTNAWVRLVAYSYGWYGVSKIYWRTRN